MTILKHAHSHHQGFTESLGTACSLPLMALNLLAHKGYCSYALYLALCHKLALLDLYGHTVSYVTQLAALGPGGVGLKARINMLMQIDYF